MTEHSFNKQNDAKNAAETPTEWNQFGTHTNRYQAERSWLPIRTLEEGSAHTTQAVLFTLKGATLTMTDALKIAAAARECACCHTASDAANADEKESENGQ